MACVGRASTGGDLRRPEHVDDDGVGCGFLDRSDVPGSVAAAVAAVVASCPAGERSAVERSSDGPDAVEEPDAPPVAVDGPYEDEPAAEAVVDVRESSFCTQRSANRDHCSPFTDHCCSQFELCTLFP